MPQFFSYSGYENFTEELKNINVNEKKNNWSEY